VLKFF